MNLGRSRGDAEFCIDFVFLQLKYPAAYARGPKWWLANPPGFGSTQACPRGDFCRDFKNICTFESSASLCYVHHYDTNRSTSVSVDRRVAEILEAHKNNQLLEMFGAGTAAVVSPISGFGYKGEKYEITPQEDSYAKFFKKTLNDIQYNLSPDPYGWRVKAY